MNQVWQHHRYATFHGGELQVPGPMGPVTGCAPCGMQGLGEAASASQLFGALMVMGAVVGLTIYTMNGSRW